MLEGVEEKVNALTKLADLVGKKTLVMWCIVTTFTTGYLFIDGRSTERELNKMVLKEVKEGQAKLVEELKAVKYKQQVTDNKVNIQKDQMDSTMPRLDTLINNANKTLNKIK